MDFLQDIDSDFCDVLYHTKIKWLSLGNMSKRLCKLKEEIMMFFEMKYIVCNFSTETQNTEWMSEFAFATHTRQKTNELNKKLQGKKYLLMIYIWRTNHSKQSLHFLQKQMTNKNFAHFPLLKSQVC